MANFPTSPSVGEQFSTSKVTYRWNGAAWDVLEGVKQGIIASITASNTKLLLHGEDLTDSSSEGHTLVANGDAAVSATQKKYGSTSIALDGTGDFIEIAQSNDFALDGDFTIDAWVWKPGNNPSDGYDIVISTNSNGGNNGGGWYMEWSDTRGLYMHDGVGNASVIAWNDTNYTSDSTWHHIAVVRSSGTVKFYLDGVEKATASYSTALVAGNATRIGAVGSGQYKFNGYMDEVRVVKGSAEWTANFTPPTSAYPDPVLLPIGSIELTEGAEPSAVQGSSIIYATSSGMFVKDSVGTVTALTANASLNNANQVELSSVTATPTGVASTGQLLHWDRSGEDDPYTKLLIHADGAFTGDSSVTPHTVTVNGPLLADAQSKFGGKSYIFDGTNDYLSIPNSTDFQFGSGDCTIEAWVYIPVAQASGNGEVSVIAKHESDSSGGWVFTIDGTAFRAYYNISGWGNSITHQTALTTSTWHHLAFVRSGNTCFSFLNGVKSNTIIQADTGAVTDAGGPLYVGARHAGASHFLNGYVDEIRISKGIARYTANFTPPTAPFTTGYVAGSGLYYVAPDGTTTLIKGDS
jgi:hypothetical protein